MSKQLYLNGNLVDLPVKTIIRKIQISDIADIQNRKSTHSYAINLPMTSKNRAFLDMLGTMGNTSRKPYENIRADYVVNGIYLVINGYAIISETKGSYRVNIYDGIISLGEALKNKALSDLPLNDLNHYVTTQGYIDSFDNTEGYIYGIADFGLGVISNIKVEEQSFSVYSHTIFNRIFESIGVNVFGDFLTNNTDFLNEVITPVKGYEILNSGVVNTDKGSVDLDTISEFRSQKGSTILIDEDFSLSNSSLIDASIVSDEIVFTIAGSYTLNLTIDFDSSETNITLVVDLNGSGLSFLPLANDSEIVTNQTKYKTVVFNAEVNDVISFRLTGNSGYIPDGFDFYEVDYSVDGSVDMSLQTGGQLIEVANYLGDTGQIDFVKEILRRYGLIMQPIKDSVDFNIKRIEDILNDRANAEDWSGKVQDKISEKYTSGYAKNNKAVYKYPDSIIVPNNDGVLIVENENALHEKNMINSIFEIPEKKGSLGGNDIYIVPIWADDSGNTELKETPLKIMSIARYNTAINAKLFNEATGINESTNVPFLSLENISLQYLLDENYKAFKTLINDFKKCDFSIKLSVIDIYNLDFFKLKYLSQTGKYYYLNSVISNEAKNSKINMIEINDFNN